MVLFAMRTQEWAEAETVRPPLNLLAIPLQALRWCIKWMRRPKVLNDGGSQNETFYAFYKVFTRAGDSDKAVWETPFSAHLRRSAPDGRLFKVEEWIKVAFESEPGTDEDRQGHDSLDAYLRAFSDIVVCKPMPLVPENERPVREADGDGSNKLDSVPKELTGPTDAGMDLTEAESSDTQPPSNEHRVPRGDQGVARGDSRSNLHSEPNEESVELHPECAAPQVLGMDSAQGLMAAATATDAQGSNWEHRDTGMPRDDDPVSDAHTDESCTAAKEQGLPSVSTALITRRVAKLRIREYDAALRWHLWLGHQVVLYVNERGLESTAEEDESWRRAMKKAIIDKIKELGFKTDSKISEIDSKLKELKRDLNEVNAKMNKLDAKIGAQNGKIDQQNGKIDELIREVRCVLRTMHT